MQERMDSVEAVQEVNSLKLELIETEIKGLKKKVNSLETKDREILGDLSKLDRKFSDLRVSTFSQKVPYFFLNIKLQLMRRVIEIWLIYSGWILRK